MGQGPESKTDANVAANAGKDGAAKHPTEQEIARQRLLTDSRDKVVKPADAGDRSPEKLAQQVVGQARDAFGHLNAAKEAGAVIKHYLDSKTNLNDKVTVKGPDGKDRQITVGEHIKELRQTVDSEANAAVVQAQHIDRKSLSQAQSSALIERNGINKEIEDARKAGQQIPAEKMQALQDAQKRVDTLKTVENAEAFTKMAYAEFKGNGMAGKGDVTLDNLGRINVNTKDSLDAMQLLTEAGGNNPDLRKSNLYSEALREVYPRLASVTDKAATITDQLQKANDFGKQGNAAEQEKMLKAAVEQADGTNMAVLAQLLRDPKFNSRQSDEVLDQMATTVSMAGTARLKYAEFLVEHGRFGEAQVQTLRVRAEAPEILYHMNPDTGKPEYNNSRFLNLKDLDSKVTASSNFDPVKLNSDINQFTTRLSQLQGDATVSSNDTAQAKAEKEQNNKKVMEDLKKLQDSIDGQLATQKKDLEDSKKALDARQAELQQQAKGLDSRSFLTDEARQIEKDRINRELELSRLSEKVIDDQLRINKENTQLARFHEVRFDLARDDRSAANAKLNEIDHLGGDFTKNNQQSMDLLKKAAEEPGWWDTWGKKAAIVGAVAVGVAAGIWLGPGAIATGAAAGEAAALALGVTSATGLAVGSAVGVAGGVGAVTVAGAAAGGAVVGVGRGVAELTGGVRTSTDSVYADIKDGAMAGGTAAFWTAAPLGAMRVMKAAAPVAEGGIIARTTTSISEAGFKPVGSALREAAVAVKNPSVWAFGTGVTAVQTGLDSATNTTPGPEQSLGDSSLHFARQAVMNTMLTPMSGLLRSEGAMSRIAAKVLPAANVAERAPLLASAIVGQGFQQPIATWSDIQNRNMLGAADDQYRKSIAVFGPWTPGTYDPTKSTFQAGALKARYEQLNGDVSSSFYSDKIFAPDYNPMIYNTDSVFSDAEQLSTKRDQQK